MTGIYHIKVNTKRLTYDLDIRQKVTVIRGDSGTGKTLLVKLIEMSINRGIGIEIISKAPCRAIIDLRDTWKLQIENLSGCIIFIDETVEFILTEEFAEVVSKSDNYFVIVTRAKVEQLPFSVNEILEMTADGKHHTLKRLFPKGLELKETGDF